jgi:hypothetical protein
MKDIKFLLPAVLLIPIFLSCENEEPNDITTFTPNSSENGILAALQKNLISQWDFENSTDDILGNNNFEANLPYDMCWYDYIPGKVGVGLWIRVGELKCKTINTYITEGKPFSFLFWGNGYNQQDNQRYFSLKSDINSELSLNINVQKNFMGKTNDYIAYLNSSKDHLTSVKLNRLKGWYYYGITYDKSELKFYINGELQTTISWNYIFNSVDNYYIVFSPIRILNEIYIDNAKFFNKELRSNEIMLFYKLEE